MIHIVYGTDYFQVIDHVSTLKQSYKRDWQVLDETTDYQYFYEIIYQQSFLDNANYIQFKNPWFLTDKVDNKSDIMQLLTKATDDRMIVLYCPGKKLDTRLSVVKQCLKQFEATQYAMYDHWEGDKIINWLTKRITAYQLSAEANVPRLLHQFYGNDLQRSDQLIQTIQAYLGEAKHITSDHVSLLAGKPTAAIHKAWDAFIINDQASLHHYVRQLLDAGHQPVAILLSLATQCRLLLALLAHPDLSDAALATSLKKHPYFIKKQRVLAKKHHTLDRLIVYYNQFATADFEIRAGYKDPNSALFCALTLNH